MASLTLQLKPNENKFRHDFTNAFYEKEYEIAVIKIHSHAKILYTFEYVKYDKKDDKVTPEVFEIEISNNFEDFNDIVEQITTQLPHGSKNAFDFELDENNHVHILIKQPNFEIDFTSSKTIGKLLGFDQTVLKSGEHVAKCDFQMPNKTIFMTCNHLESSYFNSQRRDILYSFTAKNGYVYLANTPIYLKTLDKLKDLYITLVNIDNNKIEFEELDLLVNNLHLKPC
jgi:hypothetical protein